MNADLELTLQLKDMELTDAAEFKNTSFRRYIHYIQLIHHDMLMNEMSERFMALESHVNSGWR